MSRDSQAQRETHTDLNPIIEEASSSGQPFIHGNRTRASGHIIKYLKNNSISFGAKSLFAYSDPFWLASDVDFLLTCRKIVWSLPSVNECVAQKALGDGSSRITVPPSMLFG